MEDLRSLRMKKKLLLIELSAIEQKISLYEDETTATEVLEHESVQTQTTTVTSVPEHESVQTKAIPKQTALGKETTNPLTAEVLLKNLLKEKTTPLPQGTNSLLVNPNPPTEGLSKMTILSSVHKSEKNLDLRPDYKKALKKPADKYYVIYSGPHAGIHTDWAIVETFCKTDKVTCRGFRTEEGARLSQQVYQEEMAKPTNKKLLRPKTVKEKHRDQRFDNHQLEDIQEQQSPLSFEDFRSLWNKARAACPEDLVHEKFYTTDKKTKSIFNFIEGADARLIQQAYAAGLIDNIYPSANLLELKFLPGNMVEKIKTFRRKVLKAKDEPIYIRFTSSIPEWIHGSIFPAYHFIEVGIANNKRTISQSEPMNDLNDQLLSVLHNNRINGLRRICEKLLEILKGSKKKINYVDSHCIVTSWSFSNITPEDKICASTFGEKFFNNIMQASSETCKAFCKHAHQLFDEHQCRYCKEESTDSSNEKEEVTIEDVNTEDDKSEKDKSSSSQ